MLTIGDAREWATTLAPGSVQTIVTSPPYFGLRDYGTARWENETVPCDHAPRNLQKPAIGNDGAFVRALCTLCGAVKVDRQMGSEATPDEFVANLVALFRALREALRDDGTLWLNLGDSYNSGTQFNHKRSGLHDAERYAESTDAQWGGHRALIPGMKTKDLIGIPWLVAFALRADGWYLRSDIIWHKPNPMPESVRDRPTRSHEYLFLLSKSATYFYDQDAIREPHARLWDAETLGGSLAGTSWHDEALLNGHGRADRAPSEPHPLGRNKRDVWTVATQPYPDAHFATFPPELIRPCILAGTSAKGACVACGAPWRRTTEREATGYDGSRYGVRAVEATGGAKSGGTARSTLGSSNGKLTAQYTTTGWEPSCTCGTTETRPCVVADPFAGSGTTAMVAVEEGRHWVACDLDQRAREWTRARLDGRQIRMAIA